MAKRSYDKKPLYRRVNRTARGAPCGHGGEARWARNTKAERRSDVTHQGMGPKHRHGLDYTPLYRFLLSRIGTDWDTVHSEAVSRLDQEDPIYNMVARHRGEAYALVRVSESSYFSGLFVDDQNILRQVAPDLSADELFPTCPCCTHTLNGQPFSNPFDLSQQYALFDRMSVQDTP